MDYELTIKRYIKDNAERIMSENDINKPNEITDTMAIKLIQKDSYMYSSKLTLKYIGISLKEIIIKMKPK